MRSVTDHYHLFQRFVFRHKPYTDVGTDADGFLHRFVTHKTEYQHISPIRHVDRIGCPVTVACAEHEAAEFYRQSREFSSALKLEGRLREAMVGTGLNHFEIIQTLGDPASPLGRAALNMLA